MCADRIGLHVLQRATDNVNTCITLSSANKAQFSLKYSSAKGTYRIVRQKEATDTQGQISPKKNESSPFAYSLCIFTC